MYNIRYIDCVDIVETIDLPAADRCFSLGNPVSSNKTDRHDIAKILLNMVLNSITLTQSR